MRNKSYVTAPVPPFCYERWGQGVEPEWTIGVRACCMKSPLTGSYNTARGREKQPPQQENRSLPCHNSHWDNEKRFCMPFPCSKPPTDYAGMAGIFLAQQEVAQRKDWAETHYMLRVEKDYTKTQMWKVGHWHVWFQKPWKYLVEKTLPCWQLQLHLLQAIGMLYQ